MVLLSSGTFWVEWKIGTEAILARALRGFGIRPIPHFIAYGFSSNKKVHPPAIHPSDIVFLGDSITCFGDWTSLFPQISVKNYGLPGDTTKNILNRLDEVITGKPKKIFLMIGINDLIRKLYPVATMGIHYRQIFERIQRGTPQTSVFVQSVLPINYFLFSMKVNIDDVIQVNAELKNLASEFSFQYIDLFNLFADAFRGDQLHPKFTMDGLHLNSEGYQLWKKNISPWVLQ